MKTLMKMGRWMGVAVLTVTIACLTSVQAKAWGPERPTYTNASPADYATFNSITDNAAVGDERNFVRIGEVGSDAPYTDEIEIVPGKEYEVYIYYHNDAASETNATGYGMATNTRVSSAYPTILNPGERGMVSGIVSWSYVTPNNPNDPQTGKVWDEAYVTTQSDGVVLRYKTGTAIIHNAGKANGSVMSASMFTEEGALIGYNKMAGTIPGCAEYSGYITYTLVAEKIDSEISKQVSLDGENWAKEVTVKPGDFVTYKVVFNNTGNTTLTNVIFKDTHDEGLSLRSGSTKVFDVDNVDGLAIDDIIDISGYNTGDAAAGALVQVIYQLRVSDDKSLCNKTLNNTISVAYNSEEQKADDASVIVTCEEEVEEQVDPACEINPDMEGCEPTCETNPEMEGCSGTPSELPNTGPLEIVMAIIVVLGIAGGGYYFYRTQRTLNKVERKAKGEDVKEEDIAETKEDGKDEEDKNN